ncbi:uncharacterized protein B0I36DRAFT_361808 [Microdochium trichocladiopsis]|uniref:HypA protein n=1 Tax=Microdochium trichocladiopsis TaxID=1682393 RepID=A0A9P8Y6M4_9PEZI|nr:uncharacterized protein B0I36DRAFT_361808 [Microdochium trichocladiopsis]KAH7033090.1 hypothetical protein B0I36DRAFT_361808 [Microdochium trichocladiopsis]
MAITGTISIAPDNTGLWALKQSDAAAKKTSELLQQDFENHHVFFNQDGFHNHISHHILSLYGTGASIGAIEKGYKDNSSYQRPVVKPHDDPAQTLRDWETAKKRLGKEQYYTDFLIFFRAEIERLGGWQQVLQEYLFKQDDERSLDMLVRMHSGFLHPMIQLMFGVEWSQPTIVAMALAQASVHGDAPYRKIFLEAEDGAVKNYQDKEKRMPSIISLMEEMRANEKIANSTKLSDGNKIRDGVMKRAPDETMRILTKVHVSPENFQEELAQMIDANVYAGASAAIRQGKQPRWDFFLIHHINVLPIYIVLGQQDWIPLDVKVRLLEWKIRIDLLQYAARVCPELSLDKITSYTPKNPTREPDHDLVVRVHNIDHDDGHAIKLLRAVGAAKKFTEPFRRDVNSAAQLHLQLRDDAIYNKIYHLVADAVESGESGRWIRGAGDPEAWQDVPDTSATDSGKL